MKKRFCLDCATDISDRWRTAKRCHECARKARNRINGRYALKWRQERMWLSRVYRRVSYAIETGELPKPSDLMCVDCGSHAEVYDHRDYNLPLDVEPVCRRCNYDRGRAKLPDEAA